MEKDILNNGLKNEEDGNDNNSEKTSEAVDKMKDIK